MASKESKKKFKIKYKKGWFFYFAKRVVQAIRGKVKIIYTDEPITHPAIAIGNHSAISGPMTYSFSLPLPMMYWTAHSLCGNYRERRRYLIDVFYRQKKGYGKVRAFFAGTAFGLVQGILYRTAGMVPVYYDHRVKRTFEYSLQCLQENVNLLILPENSDNGYKDPLKDDLHAGYLSLAKLFRARTGKDVPIYPMYFSREKNCIVVGAPRYLSKMSETMDKKQINTFFLNAINSLAAYVPEGK